MNEAEFDRILDVVRAAIAPDQEPDQEGDQMFALLAQFPLFRVPREAANDNGPVWPLIPFPEGWYATC